MQEVVQGFVSSINEFLWSYLLIAMLIAFGLFFTFRSKFLQIRLLKEMIRVLKEGADSSSKDGISPFQAFCISMAARVGTGNITGIAIAIALGDLVLYFDVGACGYRFSFSIYRKYISTNIQSKRQRRRLPRRTGLLYGKRFKEALDGRTVCCLNHFIIRLNF